MTDDTERQPPHDLDAERIVVGAAISDRRALDDVSDIIRPTDLYRPAHAVIFATARDLADADPAAPITPVAVAAALTERGEITRVGGAPYLAECVGTVPTLANAGYFARIVSDRARARALVAAGLTITQLGYDGRGDVDDIEERARAAIEAATAPPTTTALPSLADALPEWIDAMENPPAAGDVIAPPYCDLRDHISGWRPGQLIVIGARPSVGKTTVGLDIARAAAIRDGHPVLFVSLEMSRDELIARITAAEARVSLSHITDHRLTPSDWDRIAAARPRIADAPLFLDDASSCGLAHLRARLRHMARTGAPARLVVVDYLGLMDAPAGENRQQEVAQIARGLKSIAREHSVPVVALAQLNRGVEQRQDKRPGLSDLRDSGAIEQDADIVLFLHRPDYQNKESDRSGELDVLIAKNRQGSTGEVTIAAQMHYGRCVDLGRGAQ
jgi:replicative DNA helicase